jgi:hypothetical protein
MKYAYLVDLLSFEYVLKDLKVSNVLVLVPSVHLNARHLHVAWKVQCKHPPEMPQFNVQTHRIFSP